ncbi:LDB16 (YCL005W) [Zygosaccharomyces parabailii]|nr:LDB16 (YCL005W) [Zygosaccharomyces parabailii]CDH11636.1 uncharacterized protein ZBAI_03422 [Zygosaccharomyces bailii ISA1307]
MCGLATNLAGLRSYKHHTIPVNDIAPISITNEIYEILGMALVTKGLNFLKDLGLFLLYSCGYCTSIVFDIFFKQLSYIHGITSRAISFFKELILVPLRIIVTVLVQLFFLPVNIPLKLLLGTSLKDVLVHAKNWTDGYVTTTILQYLLALTVFGVSIGAFCGASFSLIDSMWRIPDIYVEVPIRFWRYLPTLWRWAKASSRPNSEPAGQLAQKFGKFGSSQPSTPSSSVLKSSLGSPLTPKYRYDTKHWSRPPSVSRENILKVASQLPSDFFQESEFDNRLEEEMQNTSSPSQSSRGNTHNSSNDFTSIWDKIDGSPTTLRTEDSLATLSKRKAFPNNKKNGTLAVK